MLCKFESSVAVSWNVSKLSSESEVINIKLNIKIVLVFLGFIFK